MREYSFHATDTTLAALRRLRAPWASYAVARDRVTVRLADGTAWHLTVEGEAMEPALEALRIAASASAPSAAPDESGEADAADGAERAAGDFAAGDFAAGDFAAGDFAAGGNDVVLFHGVTWTEGASTAGDGDGAPQGVQFSGRLGVQPETAEAVCVTTDAVVFAARTGEGLLVRLGVRPYSLETVTDRLEIARFLVQRGYTEG